MGQVENSNFPAKYDELLSSVNEYLKKKIIYIYFQGLWDTYKHNIYTFAGITYILATGVWSSV